MTRKDKKLSTILDNLKADYLRDLPRKLDLLKTYTNEENWPKIYEEYHKLKGTGRTYGYPVISILCEKLEKLAEDKATQKQKLFLDALEILNQMHAAYAQGKDFDVANTNLGKILFKKRK